jgi:hypothetical protein
MKIREIIDKIDEQHLFVPAFQRENMNKDKIKKLYEKVVYKEQFEPHVVYAKYHPPLSDEEIFESRLDKLTRAIHAKDFSEEYDFMYDSVLDKKDRDNGISPMRQEYIDKYTKKRENLGVKALSESGMVDANLPGGSSSFDMSLTEAKHFLINLDEN